MIKRLYTYTHIEDTHTIVTSRWFEHSYGHNLTSELTTKPPIPYESMTRGLLPNYLVKIGLCFLFEFSDVLH